MQTFQGPNFLYFCALAPKFFICIADQREARRKLSPSFFMNYESTLWSRSPVCHSRLVHKKNFIIFSVDAASDEDKSEEPAGETDEHVKSSLII